MDVIENILRFVKKHKSQSQQTGYFSPYANLNCLYLKIGLCNFSLALDFCFLITFVNIIWPWVSNSKTNPYNLYKILQLIAQWQFPLMSFLKGFIYDYIAAMTYGVNTKASLYLS